MNGRYGATLRGVGLSTAAVLLAGILVVIGSFWTWDICGKEPCEGAGGLFHIYLRSGLELGLGVATAVLGALLILCGILGRRRRMSPLLPMMLGILVLVILLGYIVRVHLIPEYRVDGVGLGLIIALLGGVLALVASASWARRLATSPG